MTWLAWRQLRAPAAATSALVALLLAAVLLVRAGHTPATEDAARQLIGGLRSLTKRVVVLGDVFVLLLPAAIGMFWGAPLLARELEHGTHRLAWAQSVTRTRWLLTKLLLTAAATIVVSGTATLTLTRWATPIDTAIARTGDQGGLYLTRIAPLVFTARGVLPIALSLFALSLGVLVGLLSRRTLPAMVITLLVFAATSLAVPQWIRPHLVTPVTVDAPIGGAGTFMQFSPDAPPRVILDRPSTWILSQHTVDHTGHPSPLPASFQRCAQVGSEAAPDLHPCFTRLNAAGYHQHLSVQPNSHFWPLQLRESALYILLSLLLLTTTLHRIRTI
jgi:hypothetical protein